MSAWTDTENGKSHIYGVRMLPGKNKMYLTINNTHKNTHNQAETVAFREKRILFELL